MLRQLRTMSRAELLKVTSRHVHRKSDYGQPNLGMSDMKNGNLITADQYGMALGDDVTYKLGMALLRLHRDGRFPV